MGLPAHTAVATNRVGVFGLAATGWVPFQKQKLIRHNIAWVLGIACGFGAVIGTKIFLSISETTLRQIIGVVSVGLLLFTALKKEIGVASAAREGAGAMQWVLGIFLAVGLGAYGSIYGAGFGTFFTYVLIYLFGQTFLESAGTRKAAEGIQALVSSYLYYRENLIAWPEAVNLFVGMGIGSYLGALYGANIGNLWIRRAFLALAAVLSVKILW